MFLLPPAPLLHLFILFSFSFLLFACWFLYLNSLVLLLVVVAVTVVVVVAAVVCLFVCSSMVNFCLWL